MLRNGKSSQSTTSTTEAEVELSDSFSEGDGNPLKNGEIQSRKIEEEIFVPRIHWINLLLVIYVYGCAPYGFYLLFAQAKPLSFFWLFIMVYATIFAVTAGAHRLWSHRTYKAKWPLRLILILLFTITAQRSVYTWALDHRVHHKYSETNADPHNAKRGFFFAHVGWLFAPIHPEVEAKKAAVDMSDLEADPLVMWQRRHYLPIYFTLSIVLSAAVPYFLWGESLWVSFWVHYNLRSFISINITFFVNSAAHMWGQKPYDKYISPADNITMSITTLGEGWHNYHHVFPWDYRAAELGNYRVNVTTVLIDLCALLGLAYDRKSVSPDMVRRRANRTGDGSHVWGYGDPDIPSEDLKELESMDRKSS